MSKQIYPAPEILASDWLNTSTPIKISEHSGKVIVIEAFQMLCPGCVSHGLPQAQRILGAFNPDDVTVLGLHSVFEHHDVQGTRAALAAFLHENRLSFPVAIDAWSEQRFPKTMAAYQLEGTPSLILVDGKGQLRETHFGTVSDLVIGAQIMQLVVESKAGGNASQEQSN